MKKFWKIICCCYFWSVVLISYSIISPTHYVIPPNPKLSTLNSSILLCCLIFPFYYPTFLSPFNTYLNPLSYLLLCQLTLLFHRFTFSKLQSSNACQLLLLFFYCYNTAPLCRNSPNFGLLYLDIFKLFIFCFQLFTGRFYCLFF